MNFPLEMMSFAFKMMNVPARRAHLTASARVQKSSGLRFRYSKFDGFCITTVGISIKNDGCFIDNDKFRKVVRTAKSR